MLKRLKPQWNTSIMNSPWHLIKHQVVPKGSLWLLRRKEAAKLLSVLWHAAHLMNRKQPAACKCFLQNQLECHSEKKRYIFILTYHSLGILLICQWFETLTPETYHMLHIYTKSQNSWVPGWKFKLECPPPEVNSEGQTNFTHPGFRIQHRFTQSSLLFRIVWPDFLLTFSQIYT